MNYIYIIWDRQSTFVDKLHPKYGSSSYAAKSAEKAALDFANAHGDRYSEDGEYYMFVLEESEARRIYADTPANQLAEVAEKAATYFRSYTTWGVEKVDEDTEPDEWGWHIKGERMRYDGYETKELAEDDITMACLKASKAHESFESVGPYPYYDGAAMEDYDE